MTTTQTHLQLVVRAEPPLVAEHGHLHGLHEEAPLEATLVSDASLRVSQHAVPVHLVGLPRPHVLRAVGIDQFALAVLQAVLEVSCEYCENRTQYDNNTNLRRAMTRAHWTQC
jgi:hypothetical protein